MSDEPSTTGPTPAQGAGVRWLPTTNGLFTFGTAGLAAFGLFALGIASVDTARGVALVLAGIFVAVASWVVLLRPRLGLGGSAPVARAEVAADLVMRGMVSDLAIPLTEITRVELRQTLVVATGSQVWRSTALGRPRRQLVRRRPPADGVARGGIGFVVPGTRWGASTGPDTGIPQGVTEVDVVLSRIERARQDAALHRLPGGAPRRTWARVEIAALTLSAVGSIVALLLG